MKNIKDLGEKEVKINKAWNVFEEIFKKEEISFAEIMVEFAEIQVKQELQDILNEWEKGKFQIPLNKIIRERFK